METRTEIGTGTRIETGPKIGKRWCRIREGTETAIGRDGDRAKDRKNMETWTKIEMGIRTETETGTKIETGPKIRKRWGQDQRRNRNSNRDDQRQGTRIGTATQEERGREITLYFENISYVL